MGEFVVILASFFLGVLMTALLISSWLYFQLRKITNDKSKKSSDPLTEMVDALEKAKTEHISVKERLTNVRTITQKQLDLSSRAEQPQKNSLDGKYKNSLSKEIKQLEEEKATILRSILADGYDPEVSILGPDGTEKMLLSQFLTSVEGNISSKEAPPVKTSKLSYLRGGKLSSEEADKIINDDSGNDDSGNKTNN